MTEKGEHGATAIWVRAPGSGLVQLRDQPLRVREHGVDVLDQLVRWQAAVRDPEIHRPAGRDEPAAELAGRLHLGLDEAGAAAREDVVVVEDGGAAREHQLGDPGPRRRVLGLGVDPRPGRVELDEPLEQRRLLGSGARERLVEVVVGVDEAGRDESAAEPRALVRVRLGAGPDRGDEAVLEEDPAVRVLRLRVVHGQHVRGGEQGLHARYRIVARVEVITPRSLDEALRLKSERPDARPIAGGTDLLVELNFDRTRPETILNLAEVAELKGWSRENGSLRLGAGLTYTEAMQPELAELLPALAEASRTVGSPQIRNRGTIGGNLGTASPAGDAHPPLLVEDATVEIGSTRGVRTLPLTEFFLGPKRNALEEDELVLAVRIDPSRQPQTFMKVGPRNAMVIAVCSLAVGIDRERGELRAAYGSAGPVPALVTAPLDAREDFPELVAGASSPIDDVRGTAAYRRHALRVLTKRALDRVFA